jgi:hypothetical protein
MIKKGIKTMKNKLLTLVILFIFIILSFSVTSCSKADTFKVNQDVINSRDFYLTSEGVPESVSDTSLMGTVYIYGNSDVPSERSARVIAWGNIGSGDVMGIWFSFRYGWEINCIDSSYRNAEKEILGYSIGEYGRRVTISFHDLGNAYSEAR